ncbi:MAG: neutral zinc metallopeptidase [Nocardioides sp.]|nr:neutral zinc metallopeptidase [Nocardioides sp.]
MRFNPRARIDTGRTRDAGRGRAGRTGGSGSGMSIPFPSGGVGKGGIGGVIVVVLFLVVTQCLGDTGTGTGSQTGAATGTSIDGEESQRYDACQSGADANENPDCARAIVENSLRAFWSRTLPAQSGTDFTPTQVVTFTDAISTGGCGEASAAVGPFYCPVDATIYLDSTFFAQVLEGQLGGSGGDFVEPYVLAHEYGHHLQALLGTLGQVRTQQGPESDAVRLELQADCYAGMWAKGALETTDESGVRIFESLDDAAVREALDAAKTVGDDLIQQRTQGRVDPDGWTHGSSAERQRWFSTGFGTGDLAECDTFSADQL